MNTEQNPAPTPRTDAVAIDEATVLREEVEIAKAKAMAELIIDARGWPHALDESRNRVAQLRAALEVAREALETLAKNDNYGAGDQFVTYVHVCNFAEQAIARIDAIIHVRKCSQSLQK